MEKFRDLIVNDIASAKLVIVGLPYDEGCSCGKGAALAPDMLRELSGFLPPYTMDGKSIESFKIYDYGNIYYEESFHIGIEEEIKKVFDLKKFPLFIGGDHSVSIPIQKVFIDKVKACGKTPVIIHIDAHPDICDFYDESYFSHACPIMRAIENGYDTENINLIGIRGFEKQEVEYFKKHPEINVYLSSEINNKGFEYIIKELKDKYNDSKYAIYLSYDIDANDPSFAPGTGTPEAFGLNSFKLMNFIKNIISDLNILAMDIVEISPPLDCNNITSWLALKTMYEVFDILNKKFVK